MNTQTIDRTTVLRNVNQWRKTHPQAITKTADELAADQARFNRRQRWLIGQGKLVSVAMAIGQAMSNRLY